MTCRSYKYRQHLLDKLVSSDLPPVNLKIGCGSGNLRDHFSTTTSRISSLIIPHVQRYYFVSTTAKDRV
jgi:hypothetical protein